MEESSDRVRKALENHLDYLEMGGPRPDTSHLSPSEREELDEVISALELTQGVALGLGRIDESEQEAVRAVSTDSSEVGKRVLAQLKETLPPDVRIEWDATRFLTTVGGVPVADGWVVGTFGGRLRVWLLDVDRAQELEANRGCLADLNRVFAAFSDTAAVALVAQDLTCLIVQPEDCAPQIDLPSGSLFSRRYRQPVRLVAEAAAGFLKELTPYWDPIPAFDRPGQVTIDASAIAGEFTAAAIERQRSAGQRARKGNPKKDALLRLGDREVAILTTLARGLLDGTVEPNEIDEKIQALARER